MRQLMRTLQALDDERLMQFQNATAVLRQQGLPRKQSGTRHQLSYVVEVYQYAADVIQRALELEGVFLQHVSADNWISQATSDI
jgi:hypothetical protein